MLNKYEIEFYNKNGYCIPKWKLSGKKLEDLTMNVNKLILENQHIRQEQVVCPHIKGGSMGKILGNTYKYFIKLAYTKEIIRLVSSTLGKNIILWGSQVFCKPAKKGMSVPMHQDSYYWPINPMSTCSVWIAIDRSTKINGCLKVIPKSHKKIVKHEKHFSNTALDSGISTLDFKYDIDYIELKPGQISIHDANLIHGSNANNSGFRRAGIVFRYMNSNSIFDRKKHNHKQKDGHIVNYSHRPIWLISGTPGKNTLVRRNN